MVEVTTRWFMSAGTMLKPIAGHTSVSFRYFHVFVPGGLVRDCQVRPSGRLLAGLASRIGFTRGAINGNQAIITMITMIATNGNQGASIGLTPGRESFQQPTLLKTDSKAPALSLPSPQLPLVI